MRDRPTDRHRKIAEAKMGRRLGPDEVVDHADEDKANNNPSNLRVEARSVHTTRHNKNRSLSKLRAALRMVKEGKRLY